MKNKISFLLLVFGVVGLFYYPSLNLQKLSKQDAFIVDSILAKTAQKLGQVKMRKENSNRLSISEFKSGLSWREKYFIFKILRLKPSDLGAKTPKQPEEQRVKAIYKEIVNQPVNQNGKPLELLAPLVSFPAYEAYEKMMAAMEKNLGKRLYVESGHRSQGYHLYNFLKYLREHQYSLIETGKLNALPGYSEHNLLVSHAIDLISAEGINGEPKVEDYETLPEHQWMLKHASDFGFTLSYPRENPWGIAFEPWHWKYSAEENNSSQLVL